MEKASTKLIKLSSLQSKLLTIDMVMILNDEYNYCFIHKNGDIFRTTKY